MPARSLVRARVLATLLSVAAASGAFATDAAPGAPFANSNLDRGLFLQLLVGEMELRAGEVGSAYQVVLDAARKTHNEQLYKRAADIALEAHAGEEALAAVRAWRTDFPGSLDAHRYLIQLLVAMNRAPETAEPMGSLVSLTSAAEQPLFIANLPRFFTRSTDHKQVAEVVAQVVKPYLDAAAKPATRAAANVAMSRAWFAAQDAPRALELLRVAQAQDPGAESVVVLALEMLPTTPDAEGIVKQYLQAKPDANAVRAAYARVLANNQRYVEAAALLETVTRNDAAAPAPWLTLGALRLELHQPKEATAALERYVQIVQAAPSATPVVTAVNNATAEGAPSPSDDDDAQPASDRGLTQAWLMLAQAAEEQKDFKGAERWLAMVDSPQRALEVLSRRASLMARQGKLNEARELIRKAPERSDDDARAKVLAESQLLRDAKHWAEADSVLAAGNLKYPNDVDLLYERSMVQEKLNHLDEMERLLRRVMEIKPDHQQAYNALGYSLAERNLRLPEAKALIQKALELSPGEPFITDSLGWVEYRLGNRDEAIRMLRGAYQSRPDPEIAAHLGEVLWVSGQRDEARRVWREGRNRDSANDVLRETLARLRVDL